MATPRSVVSYAGRAAATLFPKLDELAWNRQRDAAVSALTLEPDYTQMTSRLPSAHGGTRPSHVIVVPEEGPGFDSWRPGTRNFYYEAAQVIREDLGADKVTIVGVEPGEPPAQWHERLIRAAVETRATHILTHIENDPGSSQASWTWDALWSQLSQRWDGALLGVMFDSAFKEVRAKSRRIARISENYVVVDICMPMDGSMRRGRPEVGPVNMPVCRESLALIDDHISALPKLYDVSFIGALYPYRVELLDALRARGVRVAVNPHRPDVTSTFHESRTNQPSFIDYMAGLKQSHMTINFSRSSAGPYEQLKTRVLESALAGCLLLTDDKDRTRMFFTAEDEYGYFASPDDIPDLVESYLSHPDRLSRAQQSFERTARDFAFTGFWSAIDACLERRGLQGVYPREATTGNRRS